MKDGNLMAQVIQNAITQKQLQNLRDFYNNKQVDAYTPNYSNNKNLEYHIEEDLSYCIFNPVFTELLGEHDFDTGAFKESLHPYAIHTDSRRKHQALDIMLFGEYEKHNLAIICPFDTSEHLKTLVFKHQDDLNPEELDNYNHINLIENKLDIADYQHCDPIVTQLEVDLEYTWNAGDLLIFQRDQWHCSNYFETHTKTKNFLIFFIA